jgi:hypothetical protein
VQRRALAAGEAPVFAFIPDGPEDSVLFVIARQRVVVLTPHRVRGYARDSVAYTFHAAWKSGLRLQFILVPAGGRRDTAFARLSPRASWELWRHVKPLLPAAPGGLGFRIEAEPGGPGYRVRRRVERP